MLAPSIQVLRGGAWFQRARGVRVRAGAGGGNLAWRPGVGYRPWSGCLMVSSVAVSASGAGGDDTVAHGNRVDAAVDVMLMGLAGATLTAGAELTLVSIVEACAGLFYGDDGNGEMGRPPVPLGEVVGELGLRGMRMRAASSRSRGGAEPREDGEERQGEDERPAVRPAGRVGVTGDVLLGDPSMAGTWVKACYLAFAATEAIASGGDPSDVAVTDSRVNDDEEVRRLAPFVRGVRAARAAGQDLRAARLAAQFNEGDVPPGAERSPSELFLRLNTYIILLALDEAERRNPVAGRQSPSEEGTSDDDDDVGDGAKREGASRGEDADANRFLHRLILAFIGCQARSVACLRIFVELCMEAIVHRGMRYTDLLEGIRASGRAADACLRLQACGNLATMAAQGGVGALPLDVTLGMLTTWFTLVETICLPLSSAGASGASGRQADDESEESESLSPDLARARKSARGMALQLVAALDSSGEGSQSAATGRPQGTAPGLGSERTTLPAAVPGQGLYGMSTNPWLAQSSPAFAFMAVSRGIVELALTLAREGDSRAEA